MRKMRQSSLVALAIGVLFFLGGVGFSNAAGKTAFGITKVDFSGDYDPDWLNRYDVEPKYVFVDFPTGKKESVSAVVCNSGFGYVIGGSVQVSGGNIGGERRFALARVLETNGNLASDHFGDNGMVITDFRSSSSEVIQDLASAGGDIIAAGYAMVDGEKVVALARYNSEGDLKELFDEDGKVITRFDTANYQSAHGVVTDLGKIYVTGVARASYRQGCANNTVCRKDQIFVAKYHGNGTLDQSFGNGGYIIVNIHRAVAEKAVDIKLDSEKNIIVGGSIKKDNKMMFTLARFKPDGTLDRSFGNEQNYYGYDGRVVTDFMSTDHEWITGIEIDDEDKIIAVGPGKRTNSGDYQFLIARYNTDGHLDRTFDGDGKIRTNFGSTSDEYPSFVGITNDYQVFVGGHGKYNGKTVPLIAKYDESGQLIPSFGSSGKMRLNTLSTGTLAVADGAFHIRNDNLVLAGTAFVEKQCSEGDTRPCICNNEADNGFRGEQECFNIEGAQWNDYGWHPCWCRNSNCAPGERRTCECSNGLTGRQTCLTRSLDVSRWGDCNNCNEENDPVQGIKAVLLTNRASSTYLDGDPVPFAAELGYPNGRVIEIAVDERLSTLPYYIGNVAFVKEGYTTDDCDGDNRDEAVIDVAPGASINGSQLNQLFSQTTINFPKTFVACLNSGRASLTNFPITVTYESD